MGYLGYSIGRWRHFMSYGYSIQGRIHDIALLTGGSLRQPGSPDARAFAFRVYRYINLAHLLCYKTKSSWLQEIGTEEMMQLGLLTEQERAILEPMQNKVRPADPRALEPAGSRSAQMPAPTTRPHSI